MILDGYLKFLKKRCQLMKEKITITVNDELLVWVDKQIKEYAFGSRSHAFEHAMYKLIQKN